ncbi:MAG: hypothetical protein AAF518_17855, partial [Spirochaetota bacterium]
MKQNEYFQAWKYTFEQKNLSLEIVFLVSNLGPGSFHNAVGIVAKLPNTKEILLSKRYAYKSLIADKKSFYWKSQKNSMKYRYGRFEIEAKLVGMHCKLYFPAKPQGYSLTGGRSYQKKRKNLP